MPRRAAPMPPTQSAQRSSPGQGGGSVATRLPPPPVPQPANLILAAIKFAQCTPKPVALHNVDILGRHGRRAGRAIIRFMFPVFASVTQLAGGRSRKGSLRFSI